MVVDCAEDKKDDSRLVEPVMVLVLIVVAVPVVVANEVAVPVPVVGTVMCG